MLAIFRDLDKGFGLGGGNGYSRAWAGLPEQTERLSGYNDAPSLPCQGNSLGIFLKKIIAGPETGTQFTVQGNSQATDIQDFFQCLL